MKRFYENKDRFIDKNPNLSDLQKKKIKQFFKDHPEQEGKIKDWNIDISYATFSQIINSYNERLLPKNTLSNLKEGVDYEKIYSDPDTSTDFYFIYTYKASVAFASNNIGFPIWGDLPSWYVDAEGWEENLYRDYPEFIRNDGRILFGGAKWCISMNHTSYYWDYYTHKNGKNKSFVFALYTFGEGDSEVYNKTAICLDNYNLLSNDYMPVSGMEIYDGDDDFVRNGHSQKYYSRVIVKNLDKIRECVDKVPQADFNKRFLTFAKTESNRLYKEYKKIIPNIDEVTEVVSEFKTYPMSDLKAWLKSSDLEDLNSNIYYFNRAKELFTYKMENFYYFIGDNYVRVANNIKELKEVFFDINGRFGISDYDLLYDVIKPCENILTDRCKSKVEDYFAGNDFFEDNLANTDWDMYDLIRVIQHCNEYKEVYDREIFLTKLIRDNITDKEFDSIFISHDISFCPKPYFYYTTDSKHYFLANNL